jgi:RNA polymerase sigma-70 factor (ECF subfamily)
MSGAAPRRGLGGWLSESGGLDEVAQYLVPRAMRGEADALDGLLRSCRPLVYRWALVQTGDAADAEDVTQEVLIKLHRSLHRYAGRSRFTTWLYSVTRNEALGLARRLAGRLRLARAVTREALASPAGPDDPLARLHAARVAALADTLLTGLPRRQREVFHLADLEGCSMTEVAARLRMRPVTARVHLLRARRALRARILERWPELAPQEE